MLAGCSLVARPGGKRGGGSDQRGYHAKHGRHTANHELVQFGGWIHLTEQVAVLSYVLNQDG